MNRLPATFYEDAFHLAPIGLAVSDGQGYVVDANDYLLELGGWKREELEGMMATDFYTDGAGVRHAILESMANQGRVEDHGVRFKRKDGTSFLASMSARPFQIEDNRYIVVSIRRIGKDLENPAQ